MSGRVPLDAALDRLARMLPPWLARLRHPAQFWPQFDALAREILEQADADERSYVLQRLKSMLEDNAPVPPRADGPSCRTMPALPRRGSGSRPVPGNGGRME
jgi:hypothetical protein